MVKLQQWFICLTTDKPPTAEFARDLNQKDIREASKAFAEYFVQPFKTDQPQMFLRGTLLPLPNITGLEKGNQMINKSSSKSIIPFLPIFMPGVHPSEQAAVTLWWVFTAGLHSE